jgi:biotin carboxyl carrier protein
MTASGLRAIAGGIEREVSIGAEGGVTIDGTEYAIEAIGPGAWRVSDGDGAAIVYAARDEDGCAVHADGRVYRVDIERIGARPGRKAGASEHALAAPMPATVLSVLARVGQTVKAGDALLMLEAMKMELPVRAPHDGVVTAIHCREGELVQPGVTLVEVT